MVVERLVAFGRRDYPYVILGIAAVILAIGLVSSPINHDEGQYVAATALMRFGLPYRDFAYLQTPLQPLLLAPLSFAPAGWLLLFSRAANGLFAWFALLALIMGLRKQVSSRSLFIASISLCCTNVFLFAGSYARNDALPLALLNGGVALLLSAPRLARPNWCYAGAGAVLGLAASAKISFALPAAGAGIFLLLQHRRLGWLPFIALASGGAAGLLPTMVLALLAPEHFYFQVFTYSLEAPQQWWSAVGNSAWLEPQAKISRLLKFALLGPLLIALAVSLADRQKESQRLLLDFMLVGAMVAAYLPDPAFTQYLVPVLPPLFARFAFALDGLPLRPRRIAEAIAAVACIAGVAPTIGNLARGYSHGLPLAAAFERARTVALLAKGGRVVTLSPEQVAGNDVDLDPRFVTGPFLFRTSGTLAKSARQLAGSPNWQRIGDLDRVRPDAVLVGGEGKRRRHHQGGLDRYIAEWAIRHGYSRHLLPGNFTLFRRQPR